MGLVAGSGGGGGGMWMRRGGWIGDGRDLYTRIKMFIVSRADEESEDGDLSPSTRNRS